MAHTLMIDPPQIVVVGSHGPGFFVRVARVPVAGESVPGWDYEEPVDGAKGSNQAIATARLGGQVSFVGCVGRDRTGDEGERWLREAGIDTTFLARSETEATVGGFVIIDASGIPAIVSLLGANGDLTNEQVSRALNTMRAAQIMLTQLEIRPETAFHAIHEARKLGMTTILNPAPAPEIPLADFPAVDILTPNESEALTLLGLDPAGQITPSEHGQLLRRKSGAEAVVITLGERGAAVIDSDGVWIVSAPTVEAVDTTGAGDAFNAALAVYLTQGQSLRQAAQQACFVASYTVTKYGTIPIFPNQKEVDHFIQEVEEERNVRL